MKQARVALHLGRDLELPHDAVTQTFAVVGKRGSGKTNLGVVLVEEMIPAGLPVVIIDPVGVWWGLRASANRRDPGLPVIILGGERADVPLEPTSGSVIADFIVESSKACVLDLSGMRKGEQVRFMTDFAERLYHLKAKNRGPLHLVVDECDSFAPQRAMPDQARLLGAMEDLVRRGRSRGVGMTMITQRPAVLNKNVLTQAEVLVVFQLTAPQDRAAVGEWVRANADVGKRAVLDRELPALPLGDAFLWSPSWLQKFERVHVRKRRTFDSSRTPEAGKRTEAPGALAVVDIEALKSRIAATIERAKAEDPQELRKRIAALESELRTVKTTVRVEKTEVPVLGPTDFIRLEGIANRLSSSVTALVEAIGRVAEGGRATAAHPPSPPRATATAATTTAAPRPKSAASKPTFATTSKPAPGGVSLRKGERRMLRRSYATIRCGSRARSSGLSRASRPREEPSGRTSGRSREAGT